MSTPGSGEPTATADGATAETAEPRVAPGEATGTAAGYGPRHLVWDETGGPRPLAAVGPAPLGRRFTLAVVALVVVLAGAVAVAVARPSADPDPAPADLFAVDQVAQRYRALGADLLVGARQCRPLAPEPGQTERLACAIAAGDATVTLELTSFDTAVRLRAARARALPPAADSIRSASATGAGAAFAVDQTPDGVSRLHWDAESPRPVSAAVRTDALTAPALVAFHDQRRFSGVPRPPQPWEAFASPELWRLAAFVLTDDGAGREGVECTAVPPAAEYPGTVEQVSCRYPNGVRADFGLVADRAALSRLRATWSAPPGIEPGTHWIGGWEGSGDAGDPPERGQLAYYEPVGPEPARLYYDLREWSSFAVLRGDGLTPEQLHAFWQG